MSAPTTVDPSQDPQSSTSTGTSPDKPGSDADFTAIRRALHIRAQAILDGDEKAFMSTVDRQRGWFVTAQQSFFENLQQLPVTRMWYEVSNTGLTNAQGIHGGPLLSPPIVENVFLHGTDQRAQAIQVRETFVERNGHWLLAADQPPADTDYGSSARPWAGPRLDVVTRGNLIVVADASNPGAAERVADLVESGISADAGVLGVPVDDHVLVDASTSGTIMKFDNNEAAGAVTYYVSAADGRIAGQRVKINPKRISDLAENPLLLRHELTHYLMQKHDGQYPSWVSEGLADYVAFQPGGLSTVYLSDATYQRLMARPHVLTVSGLFGQDPETDYPLAMACVTYLIEHGGMAKVKELIAAYAAHGQGPYNDQWTGRVLREVYGLTPAQVANGAFALLDALR